MLIVVPEQIGAQILDDLHSQRSTIQRARDRVSILAHGGYIPIIIFSNSVLMRTSVTSVYVLVCSSCTMLSYPEQFHYEAMQPLLAGIKTFFFQDVERVERKRF